MPYVSKINTSVDGVVPVGSNLYGICSTGASTASKTVTLSDFDVLITGVTIHVKFTYGNSASSITLTVGSTAGKPVKVSDSDTGGHWEAGSVVSFTYDGASWVQNDYLDTSSKLKYTEDAPDVGIYKNNVVQNDVANNVATGGYAIAEGLETRAIGWASHAEGSGTRASGSTSHAEGYNSVASGTGSHAEGFTTLASDGYAHAEGYYTQATSSYAHSEGYYSVASGFVSHAEGENTTASGEGSHAQNIYTLASKKAQTVIGTFNEEDTASTTTHPSADADYGQYALIIGNGSNTSNRSNALTVEWDGDVNIPAGASYKVNGVPIADTDTTYTMSISGDTLTLTPSSGTAQRVTLPDDDTTYTLTKSGSTITLTGSDGSTTSVTDDDTILQYVEDAPDVGGATNNVVINDVSGNSATGGYALAEGYGTVASGYCTHAEGYHTTASGHYSHAEGNYATASGQSAHAEGHSTASGLESHAEGYGTTASGERSHSEGWNTTASGDMSHAEGISTIASGRTSHVGGYGTEATRMSQTVIGEWNVLDTVGTDETERGKYALIIGNGTAVNARSNALTVNWNGGLNLIAQTSIADNKYAELKLSVHQTDNNVTTSTSFIRVYDDHDANYHGANMVIQSGGNVIIGSGESPTNVYNTLINGTSSDDDEYTYITSDQEIYFDSACNTIANRKRVAIDTSGNVDIQSGGSFTKSGTKIHNNITQITGTYKATSANAWEYSNKSFTVPSGHMYLVRLQLGWTSGKPIGVGVHTSTSLGSAGFPTHHFADSDGMYNSPAFLLYAGTYYLFEKRATVPSSVNTYWINAIDLLLSS